MRTVQQISEQWACRKNTSLSMGNQKPLQGWQKYIVTTFEKAFLRRATWLESIYSSEHWSSMQKSSNLGKILILKSQFFQTGLPATFTTV